jgi:PAS domain S-box-containing protein
MLETIMRLATRSTRRGGALLALCLAMVAVAFSWKSWQDHKADEIRHATVLVDLGEKSLNSYFRQVENALGLLSRDVLDERGRIVEPATAQSRVKALQSAYPDLLAVNIVALDGSILVSSIPEVKLPATVSNLDSFRRSVEELAKEQHLRIGRPNVGAIGKEWVIPLRYGLRDTGGNLRYILAATLPLSKPQSFWKDAALPAGTALGLMLDDGYLVSRHPVPNIDLNEIYGKPRTGVLIHYLQAQQFPANGHVEGPSSLDGPDFLNVFRRLSDYPVTLFVAVPMSNIRATWWNDAWFSYFLMLLLLLSGYAVYRWMLRSQIVRKLERGRAEERLQEARLRFEGIIDSATDAVVSIDAQQRITLFNRAAEKMFGYRAAEILGQPLDRLLPGSCRERHTGQIREFVRTGVTKRIMGSGGSVLGLRVNGEEFPVEASIAQLKMESGAVYTAILRDVSRRKQAEDQISQLNNDLKQRLQELELANKDVEAFSYSVAHDLRAPLRGISGFSQLLTLEHSAQLNEEARSYVQGISGSAARMGTLIDGLLALAGLTQAKVNPQRLDLSSEARAILQRLREQHPERKVITEVQEGVTAWADPRLMGVVLENLLENAWKYSTNVAEARIAFGSEQREDERVLFVKDNGAGFDMRHANRLFGMFQRLHGEGEFKGTGIGLATVRRILILHGGRIWADAAIGRGASFYFVLPEVGAARR